MKGITVEEMKKISAQAAEDAGVRFGSWLKILDKQDKEKDKSK